MTDEFRTEEQNKELVEAGHTGVFGQRVVATPPHFLFTSAENVLRNKNDTAHIVLGKDRESVEQSGYGGRAAVNDHDRSNSAAIDLVVGRAAAMTKKEKKEAIKGGGVNVDMMTDAARIYISQKADPDKYFGLTRGYIGKSSSTAVSTVAIKADAVRIMGREGIKLVTHSDKKNSKGKERYAFEGIDLIAGNTNRGLQSLVKGENLKKCLGDIFDLITEVKKYIDDVADTVNGLSANFRDHVHPPPGTAPGPQQLVSDVIQKLDWAKEKMNQAKTSTKVAELKAAYLLMPGDKNYICSKYNNTN
jgi:hypothetical protein